MSGNAPEDRSTPVPPEVPDEFAEAYRAAYERALAAQSDVAPHRSASAYDGRDAGEPDQLPRRIAPLRIGTHRNRPAQPRPQRLAPEPQPLRDLKSPRRPQGSVPPPPAPPSEADDLAEPTAYERVRDSRWFVPVLLVLLAVLLVVGAYVVGRAFTGSVGDASGSPHPRGVTAPAAP